MVVAFYLTNKIVLYIIILLYFIHISNEKNIYFPCLRMAAIMSCASKYMIRRSCKQHHYVSDDEVRHVYVWSRKLADTRFSFNGDYTTLRATWIHRRIISKDVWDGCPQLEHNFMIVWKIKWRRENCSQNILDALSLSLLK